MQIQLGQSLIKNHKGISIGLVYFSGVKNTLNKDQTYQVLCHEVDQLRLAYKASSEEVENSISIWDNAFEKLDIDTSKYHASHVNLIKRVLATDELPNINPLVNIISATAVKNLLPVGAHDLEMIEGNIVIDKLKSVKPFTPIGGKEPTDFEGVGYFDDAKVLTKNWVWRQSQNSSIQESSTEIIIPIDALDKNPEEVKRIASEIIGLVSEFLEYDTAKFSLLNSSRTSITPEEMPPLTSTYRSGVETHEISRDPELIQSILEKSVEDVLPGADELQKMLTSGRRLKVYCGYDPTSPDLHIGHLVMMNKLEAFRKLGHKVYMLIGNFTAMIGDPTDKTSARVPLTKEIVERNLAGYKDQVSNLLNFEDPSNPIEVVFNNDWLGKFTFADVLDLASEFTVQQMLKRSMFQKRLEDDKPINLTEFMYPLMQGYDTVHLDADVELGGNDQLFNMMAGRQLLKTHRLRSKVVVTSKLITNKDGQKMSKSEGTTIQLSEPARDIYGKAMGFDDSILASAYELITSATVEEYTDFASRIQAGDTDIMELKKEFAYRLTQELKGTEEAAAAQEYFEEVYQKNTYDADIYEVNATENLIELVKAVKNDMELSNSQVKRLVTQGAFSVNGETVEDINISLELNPGDIVKVGKNIAKIK